MSDRGPVVKLAQFLGEVTVDELRRRSTFVLIRDRTTTVPSKWKSRMRLYEEGRARRVEMFTRDPKAYMEWERTEEAQSVDLPMILRSETITQFGWCDDCGELAKGGVSSSKGEGESAIRWRRCPSCYRANERRERGEVGRAPRVCY